MRSVYLLCLLYLAALSSFDKMFDPPPENLCDRYGTGEHPKFLPFNFINLQ